MTIQIEDGVGSGGAGAKRRLRRAQEGAKENICEALGRIGSPKKKLPIC